MLPRVLLAIVVAGSAAGAARAADFSPAWAFRAASTPSMHRPAIDGAGTVYLADAEGRLYAIDRNGVAAWTYDAARLGGVEGEGAEGPIALGSDGSLYFAFNPAGPLVELHAVGPTGENRWVFRLGGLNTIAGPAVGPDGNVYVAHSESGRGLLILDPDGRLVRSSPGTPLLQDRGSLGSELVFGPRAPGDPPTQLYLALDMYNLQQRNPAPSLFGFELGGQQRFRSALGRLSIAGGQRQGQPAVGPSGTIYVSTTSVGQGWGVYAFAPEDGRPLWSWYEAPGIRLSEPAAGLDETIYVVQNTRNLVALSAEGEPRWSANLQGFFEHGPVLHPHGHFLVVAGHRGDEVVVQAVDAATGTRLWEHLLPRDGGESLAPLARVTFAPDGSRLYVQTSVTGSGGEGGWRLFALDVARCPAGTSDCTARAPVAPVESVSPAHARGQVPPLRPELPSTAPAGSAASELPRQGKGCSAAGAGPTLGPVSALLFALRRLARMRG